MQRIVKAMGSLLVVVLCAAGPSVALACSECEVSVFGACVPLPAGTPCGVAAACSYVGACNFTGSCIAAYKPSTTVCRDAAGPCDKAEHCTGSSTACPGNTYQPSTTVCRAQNGICDKAESCTGSSAACPADAYQPSTTACRAAAGDCDAPETCTGLSVACPADAFKVAGTVCRESGGQCDTAESCSGTSISCPADSRAADGISCENVSACVAGGQCGAGLCIGGTNEITFNPPQVTVPASGTTSVRIIHSGSGSPIQLTGVALSPTGKFALATQPTWPVTLATGQETSVSLQLATTTPGTYDGALAVQATGCSDISVGLQGTLAVADDGGGGGGDSGCGYPGTNGAVLWAVPLLGLLRWLKRRRE